MVWVGYWKYTKVKILPILLICGANLELFKWIVSGLVKCETMQDTATQLNKGK